MPDPHIHVDLPANRPYHITQDFPALCDAVLSLLIAYEGEAKVIDVLAAVLRPCHPLFLRISPLAFSHEVARACDHLVQADLAERQPVADTFSYRVT